MACNCMCCGEPISNTKHWYTISAATQAIWTHLTTCDKVTHNDGLGPGLTSDDIKPFDNYPALIEARQSKEGLLSFDSILEESLVRCMESVMHSRVKCFESLVANWGPECDHATNGCEIYHHDKGEKGPWVSTFNIPLLESIASGHFFDRTLAAPDEDFQKVREDNRRCMELLAQWKSEFPMTYRNENLKIFKKGEGLTQEFLKKPRTGEMKPGCPTHHPDLHPTAYKPQDPNEVRLILPVRGLLPMGCAKGVPGYGIIHPNLINAAVMQCYGMSSGNNHFDAMSLAPNFDLLLTQQKASDVARLIAEWNSQVEHLGERGEMVVQVPWTPSKENMKEHRDCIDPLRTSFAQTITMSHVAGVMARADENMWLMPTMSSILQDQGTNMRAMYYHILQCREGGTLDPKLDETTVQRVIGKVVNEYWLQPVFG